MKHFNIIFWSIFGISLAVFLGQIIISIWLGVKIVNEVNDNNGSLGTAIGKFIKDVNEGMK